MIIYQKRIYRADLQANPQVLYLFGDNLLRKGFGGQAAEMRGEPNAVGIVTKKKPSMSEAAFFTDVDYDAFAGQLYYDLMRPALAAYHNEPIVVPLYGLGTGLSEMPTRAPKCFRLLEESIKMLGTLK